MIQTKTRGKTMRTRHFKMYYQSFINLPIPGDSKRAFWIFLGWRVHVTLLKVVKVTYNDHRKVTGRLQNSKQLGCPVGFVRVKGFASVGL